MRTLKIVVLAVLALSLTGLGYDAVTMPRYTGPVSERFDGTTFYSASYAKKQPVDLLKWSANRNQGPWERRATRQAENIDARVTDAMRITLVNHSTLLIQIDGINLLTDPIWSESTGPFGQIGPSRYREPGIAFDKLPPIDAVFVSHSHYDHMDLPTLKHLHEVHQPKFIVGLGNGGNLAKVGIGNVIERDWWQSVQLNQSLLLTMTPAEHWSKRSVLDTNRTLWGSFVLQSSDEAVVFFAGDTGIGAHFEEVYKRYGPTEVALIPIGAYLPRWFMKDNHLSPAESLTAAATLRSNVMIPIHFGTFALGDDGQDQPLVDLLAAYRPGVTETGVTEPAATKTEMTELPNDRMAHAVQLRVLDNGQSVTFAR